MYYNKKNRCAKGPKILICKAYYSVLLLFQRKAEQTKILFFTFIYIPPAIRSYLTLSALIMALNFKDR